MRNKCLPKIAQSHVFRDRPFVFSRPLVVLNVTICERHVWYLITPLSYPFIRSVTSSFGLEGFSGGPVERSSRDESEKEKQKKLHNNWTSSMS